MRQVKYCACSILINKTQIVTLPYPLLLQKSAREALNISLKGHVIIIDEAHNLIDAISNIHSIIVTQSQLKRARAQLSIYLQKFRNRLKGKNRVYVTQVVRLLDSVSACLDSVASKNKDLDGTVNASELTAGKGVDQINLHKLIRYLGESRLARKVEGYIDFKEEQGRSSISRSRPQSIPVLTQVQSFFHTLADPASEGVYLHERDENNEVSLRYMLLDPTHNFKEVVETARAVILAGGTMSPVRPKHYIYSSVLMMTEMDDYIRHLFAYVHPDRLKLWSCGHIMPKENLIVWPLTRSSCDVAFDFTHSKRNLPVVIDALGKSLVRISGTVPDGMVVFFPSYSYLDEVVRQWQKEAFRGATRVWDLLSLHKPVFQEIKDTAGVENLLREYTQSIDNGKGGLLLSVVGGKMSEGINFADKLGRAVVVVGLPFPNFQSAQWKAKLEYIGKSTLDQGGSLEEGTAAGREFYENACMRAVNQSIGRAIRHQKDFATIVLMDRRYRTERISSKLPGWIKQSIVPGKEDKESFGDVIRSLEDFFSSK